MLGLRAAVRAKLLLKPIATGDWWLCKTGPRTLKKELGYIFLLREFVALG